jgi:hypothetical protein
MMSPPAAPWFGSDRKPPQFYRGLRIRADSNLHEQLQALIAEVMPPTAFPGRRPRLLDLGCEAVAIESEAAGCRRLARPDMQLFVTAPNVGPAMVLS